jgi:hypothetical protein
MPLLPNTYNINDMININLILHPREPLANCHMVNSFSAPDEPLLWL